jgi:hypothetical protein
MKRGRPSSERVLRHERSITNPDQETGSRVGCPHTTMLHAKRTTTCARWNLWRVAIPFEFKRDVAAMTFATDQHADLRRMCALNMQGYRCAMSRARFDMRGSQRRRHGSANPARKHRAHQLCAILRPPSEAYPPSLYFLGMQATAQLRRGSATPIAMNTPPQAWLKRRPTRRSHGLM